MRWWNQNMPYFEYQSNENWAFRFLWDTRYREKIALYVQTALSRIIIDCQSTTMWLQEMKYVCSGH